MTNWSAEYEQYDEGFRILEIFEGDNLSILRQKSANYGTPANRYLVMDPAEMANEINTKHGSAVTTAALLESGGCYAPELQKIGDYYYITTAYLCNAHGVSNSTEGEKDQHRATMILRSASLTSGWEVWVPHIDTPMSGNDTWNAIDGTLFQGRASTTDPNVYTYLVVSKVHNCCGKTGSKYNGGTFEYIRLNDDLSGVRNGDSWHTMFNALTVMQNADYFTGDYDNIGKVADAPEFYVNSKGELIMLWTTDYNGYVVCQSKSTTGFITGSWVFYDFLYDYENSDRSLGYNREHHNEKVSGGHPGLFMTPGGQLYMAIHTNMAESDDNRKDGNAYVRKNVDKNNRAKRICFIALKEDEDGWLTWGLSTSNNINDYVLGGAKELSAKTDSIMTYEVGENTTIFTSQCVYSDTKIANTYSTVRLEDTAEGAFTFTAHIDYRGNGLDAGFIISDSHGYRLAVGFAGASEQIYIGNKNCMMDIRDRSSADSSSPYNYHHKSNTANGDDNTNNSNGLETLNGVTRYRFDVKVELYQDSGVWKIKVFTRNASYSAGAWKMRHIFNLQKVIDACNAKGAKGSANSAGNIYGYNDFDFTGTLNFDLFVLNMGTEDSINVVEISQWNVDDKES